MKKLSPDHKTIADFRKDNIDCIKPVFKEFVYLCKSLDLYGAQLVAIDGSKFKAVNSKSNNLSVKTVALRLKQTEEKIVEYLKEMDKNDTADSAEDDDVIVDDLKEKICKLEQEKQRYEQIQNQMKTTGQKEVSLVDPTLFCNSFVSFISKLTISPRTPSGRNCRSKLCTPSLKELIDPRTCSALFLISKRYSFVNALKMKKAFAS